MPISAVKFYKKSADLNNTLAMANLAYLYLDAGLTEEASKILDKAKEQPEFHPNVGRALSALIERGEAESKKEEEHLKSAREQQRFFLSFAEAYFIKMPDPPSFVGKWKFPDGIEVMITQNEKEIEAKWVRDNLNYKFTGHIKNRGSRITNYKEAPIRSLLSQIMSHDEYGRGFAYLSQDGQQLFMMNLKGNEYSFETLKRAQ
jgi:hypothetical protein